MVVGGDDVSLGDAVRQGGVSLLVAARPCPVPGRRQRGDRRAGSRHPGLARGVERRARRHRRGVGVLFVMGASPSPHLADRRRRTRSPAPARWRTGCWRSPRRSSGTRSGCSWPAWARAWPPRTSCPCTTRCCRRLPDQGLGPHLLDLRPGLPIGQLVGPVTVGGIAGLVGGVEGWRWAFVAIGVPICGVALFVGLRREPARGANEQIAVLGETIEVEHSPVPISTSIAFARLRRSARSASCSSASGRSASACSACPSSSTSSWRTRSG